MAFQNVGIQFVLLSTADGVNKIREVVLALSSRTERADQFAIGIKE